MKFVWARNTPNARIGETQYKYEVSSIERCSNQNKFSFSLQSLSKMRFNAPFIAVLFALLTDALPQSPDIDISCAPGSYNSRDDCLNSFAMINAASDAYCYQSSPGLWQVCRSI